ncbi:hypothetical protein FB446DRAFT_708144 [Lentinula raphanica]|nr:hypothetical protein FB446DRAFT_708144 [Lentinula raphanica]
MSHKADACICRNLVKKARESESSSLMVETREEKGKLPVTVPAPLVISIVLEGYSVVVKQKCYATRVGVDYWCLAPKSRDLMLEVGRQTTGLSSLALAIRMSEITNEGFQSLLLQNNLNSEIADVDHPLARLLRNQRDEISSNVAFTAITRAQNPERSLTYADWAPVGSYCLGLRALHVPLTHPELPLIPFFPERRPLPAMKATLTGSMEDGLSWLIRLVRDQQMRDIEEDDHELPRPPPQNKESNKMKEDQIPQINNILAEKDPLPPPPQSKESNQEMTTTEKEVQDWPQTL